MVPQRPQILPALRTTNIKHFSAAKMLEHWEKGICYSCDDKFTRGHRCVEKNIYLLDVDSSPPPEIFYDAQDTVDVGGDIQKLRVDLLAQDDHPEISLHALVRVTTPQTMRVRGFFKKLPLTILIDSLALGSPNMLVDFSILAPSLKS